MMRTVVPVAVATLATAPAMAAELKVTVEIPRLEVAEYHRPYVAMWLESAADGAVTNLAVWYDVRKKNEEGQKWLKDMRQWWRKTGRELTLPIDGVTSATRVPGSHTVSFTPGKGALGELAPGRYELVVEAAREVGGRELLKVPFEWPAKGPVSLKAQGEHELGALTLDIQP
jgi:hypothetical protein